MKFKIYACLLGFLALFLNTANANDLYKYTGPEATLAELLTAVNSIPDDVLLKGDIALEEYMAKNPNKFTKGIQSRSALGCAGNVALFGGSLFLAPAKLLRIKGAISKLGGIKQTVNAISKGTFPVYTSSSNIGSDLIAAGSFLLGADGIRDTCFKKTDKKSAKNEIVQKCKNHPEFFSDPRPLTCSACAACASLMDLKDEGLLD